MTNPICGPPTKNLIASFHHPAPTLPLALLTVCIALVSLTPSLPAGSPSWIDLEDRTATWLVAEPDVGVADTSEKSFAWGDVDGDGDVDLVVGRKQPLATTGKRTNVLFLNENGVLTDRTAEFATESDVAADQGFLTPTNDRDILLVDVDQDGWLDVITAAELSDGGLLWITRNAVGHACCLRAPAAGTEASSSTDRSHSPRTRSAAERLAVSRWSTTPCSTIGC